jgi:deoxyribodipyrimidine photo-lyase
MKERFRTAFGNAQYGILHRPHAEITADRFIPVIRLQPCDGRIVELSEHQFSDSSGGISPTRETALALLCDFLPKVSDYASTRNYDIPGQRSVSGLSPFIRYRLIRESEVVEAVLEKHSYAKASKFIEEVAWRTYWKGYLEMRPDIWASYMNDAEDLVDCLNDLDLERLQQARYGKTGIDCFDFWVAQLKSTGWLHNHARMWFASIWIFTLRLPWQLGASFFMEHLLDGDPASNTLSWRWVGGLHTKGKHYLARAGNINRYTDGAFNPEGQLDESAQPLAAEADDPASPLGPVSICSPRNLPSLSDSPAGLLVCPEELSPEAGPLQHSPFASLCAFNARDAMDATQASPMVQTFVNGAVADAAERMAGHWGATILQFEGRVPRMNAVASPDHVGVCKNMRVYTGCLDDWVSGVASWATNENLKSVWMIQPPVGPWRDLMPRLRAVLRMRNVRLLEFRNEWDSHHWPEANAGFFKFRKGLKERILSACP